MTTLNIYDCIQNKDNLFYVQNGMSELLKRADCSVKISEVPSRCVLSISCPENLFDIIFAEAIDRVSEIIAISYKYDYFNKSIKVGGLTPCEREILLVSLISADLDDDKKYAFDRLKESREICIDGVYNFRLLPLKRKWEGIVNYIPTVFINSQLKEFVSYLLENKKKRVFIDNSKVYDCHYRRLIRVNLIKGDDLSLLKEVLLSGCGEVEINGKLPEKDEYYLKEFYGDKIYFSGGYCP